jgi:hypothetical protein
MGFSQGFGRDGVEFGRLLGPDWRDVATAADIPNHLVLQFETGHEGLAILDVLERRGELTRLIEAVQVAENPRLETLTLKLVAGRVGLLNGDRERRTAIITHLSFFPTDGKWEQIYDDVREGANTRDVPVLNLDSRYPDSHIDIEFIVHDAKLVMNGNIKGGVVDQRLSLLRDGRFSRLSIVVVGRRWKAAKNKVEGWLGDNCPVDASLDGVRDVDGLKKQMSMTMQTVIRRNSWRCSTIGLDIPQDFTMDGF